MIFFGIRKSRIKKYDDYHIKCENCNGFGERFLVYQEYFHIFFIPIRPVGFKTIKSVCLNCNYAFNEQKLNHYSSITRKPIWLYTGLILLAGLIIVLVGAHIIGQRRVAEFVANPQIGDVYRIRQTNDDGSRTFYFLKIQNIESDTVELLQSYFEYSRFVSRPTESNFFVRDYYFRVLKSDIKDWRESGFIDWVYREFVAPSRFIEEK